VSWEKASRPSDCIARVEWPPSFLVIGYLWHVTKIGTEVVAVTKVHIVVGTNGIRCLVYQGLVGVLIPLASRS